MTSPSLAHKLALSAVFTLFSLCILAGTPERGTAQKLKLASTFPASLDILGTLPNYFATTVGEKNMGLTFQVDTSREHKAPLGVFDMVKGGQYDAGWSVSYYWKSKNPGFTIFAGTPFSPFTPEEHYEWVRNGAGQELYDAMYSKNNIKAIPCGMTGGSEGVWSRKQLNTVDDLMGMRFRMPGHPGEIMAGLGANITNIPAGEIYTSFDRGVLNGVEWSRPYLDLKMGFHKISKYYYYPSWHASYVMIDLMINESVWRSLSPSKRQVIRDACHQTVQYGFKEDERLNQEALEKFQQSGVSIQPFPEEITQAAEKQWQKIVKRDSAESRDFTKAYAAYMGGGRTPLPIASTQIAISPAKKKETKDITSPTITLSSPNNRESGQIIVKDKKLTIKGRATDKNGIVEVLIDNRDSKLDRNGYFSGEALLAMGENSVLITATDRYGNVSSKKLVVNRPSSNDQPQTSQTGRRLALLIGNAEYENSGSLSNPVNDVRAMQTVLEDLGFMVMRYENCSQKKMKKAIDSFGRELKNYDVGLFFYAGHGIQVNGSNYLVPVNAQLESPSDAEYDCVRADRVLAKMENSGSEANIVILDACRNNPFERSWSRSTQGSGLAFMNAPSGSLIAYATAPGQTASDGDGISNGLYTSALLKHLQTPGIPIEDVFKMVRSTVIEESGEKQVPWESTSLTGYFYFNGQ